MSYIDCDQYQFGFKKGHSTTLCAGIVKQSIDYYISTGSLFLFLLCYDAGICFLVLMWGPHFCGVPVRPNMLNMPKSASEGREGEGEEKEERKKGERKGRKGKEGGRLGTAFGGWTPLERKMHHIL